MKDILIRTAEEPDVEAIARLEKLCFKEDPWSPASFYDEIVKNERAIYLVALSSQEIVGYMGVWEILDEGHITNVAVSPDCRRMHIAESLITRMTELTEKDGITSWTLEVRTDNAPAISLYEKLGFRTEGIRKGYYAYDGTDALIMWRGRK